MTAPVNAFTDLFDPVACYILCVFSRVASQMGHSVQYRLTKGIVEIPDSDSVVAAAIGGVVMKHSAVTVLPESYVNLRCLMLSWLLTGNQNLPWACYEHTFLNVKKGEMGGII